MLHIVGCDHYLQPYELQEFMDDVRDIEKQLKGTFYSKLEELIKNKKVAIVAEECKPNQKTIPRVLAREQNAEYIEIDMPLEERHKLGIPDDYEQRGGAVRANAIELRERHMVEKTLTKCKRSDSCLVVCGSEHIAGLRQKLVSHGHDVAIRDVTAESWFDPPWAKPSRGEL
jgi:hypothetical protein